MILANESYRKLQSSYLFSEIARRVKEYAQANPPRPVIRLGIGDVTEPLPKSVLEAMHRAVDEMGQRETFRGYGPEQGYGFLREAIAKSDFHSRGVEISPDEIFVSDGAKCDTANIQELFARDVTIGVPDPVYPVYVDTNVMAGRTGQCREGRYEGLRYLESTSGNGFVPMPPQGGEPLDLIYLCFPNNPTGATATKEQLAAWVEYAKRNKSLILFDAAYEAFIRDESLPHSIYEIEGAKSVAIEFRSLSKTAGFTGVRCAYTVVPEECVAYLGGGEAVPLRPMWSRRHTTKFNGVSYPVQRAAEAVFSEEGRKECARLVDGYLKNASAILDTMQKLGYEACGGKNSPYVWVKVNAPSWEFFDRLLHTCQIVTTPGAGFGKCGEGYIRISAFNSHETVLEAMERIKESL